MSYINFAKNVEDAGLKPEICSPTHWKIKGGKFDVNFYPDTKRGSMMYVQMTKHGIPATIEEAIKAANSLPVIDAVERKNSYKRHVRWLLTKTNICCICNESVSVKDASLEHIIPLSKGGLNNRNNFALAHKDCNSKRGNQV